MADHEAHGCEAILDGVMATQDTIAAVATPKGQGGVGIIRVSGPLVPTLLEPILSQTPEPLKALVGPFYNEERGVLDEGIALFFPNPHSFTGEDVLELQGHGSPVIQSVILDRLFALGVRLARPGEFSERAFLNGKKDLAEVEAIADLIAAQSERGAAMALRSLRGEFSREIKSLMKQLTQLRVYVEAAIDFPEEEIDFLSDQNLMQSFADLKAQLEKTQQSVAQGVMMREGIKLVLVGDPNAGKSSLLNWLTGEDTAIVTDTPGTTRDVLKSDILLDGVPIHVLDTAGLRQTEDLIEQEGIRRAEAALLEADHILWVVDASLPMGEGVKERLADLNHCNVTVVFNKIDLTLNQPGEGYHPELNFPVIYCSVKNMLGMGMLKKRLLSLTEGQQGGEEGHYMARSRHKHALAMAVDNLEEAEVLLASKQGELLAESLKWAHRSLGEIVGEFTTDDLLGEIFSSFCIGK